MKYGYTDNEKIVLNKLIQEYGEEILKKFKGLI